MTLFSVDVESTGLFPGLHGVTAFSIIEAESGGHFTCRLRDNGGYPWDPATREWADNNMPDLSYLPEHSVRDAVEMAERFVNAFPKPRTFMAWPASFDYPMLQHLWVITDRMNTWPFHHRTLDIKSMFVGRFRVPVDAKRDDLPLGIWIEPDVEHDPYHDALAQLKTYQKLMEYNG